MKLDDLLKRVYGPGLCKCGCGGVCPIANTTDNRCGAVKGEPWNYLKGHKNRLFAMDDRERFSESVYPDPNSGCYIWAGKTNGNGYGMFRILGKMHLAHRVAWLFEHGEIIDDLLLRHKCDTRCCVNTDHMLQGTVADNAFDMGQRDRGGKSKLGWPRGVRQLPNSKKFQARAPILGQARTRVIGSFATIEEAVAAVAVAREQVYGRPVL